MQPGDVATWIGVAVALLVGAGGWVFAGLGYRAAKKANELAAEANRHAAAAVTAAKDANAVAEAANQLSEEANSIVRQQAAKSDEHWFTEWTIQWDTEEAAVVLTNTGRDPAIEPSVVINGKELNETRNFTNPVPRAGELRIVFPQVLQHRDQVNAKAIRDWQQNLSHGILGTPRKWKDTLDVLVTWRTGLGQPREQRLQLKAS